MRLLSRGSSCSFRCEGMEGKTRQRNNFLQPWRSWWRMMGATRARSVQYLQREGTLGSVLACSPPQCSKCLRLWRWRCTVCEIDYLSRLPIARRKRVRGSTWKWAIAQGITWLPIGLTCCPVSPVDLLSPPSSSAQNPILGPRNTTRVRSFFWPYNEDQWNTLVRRTSCRHFDRSRQFFLPVGGHGRG